MKFEQLNAKPIEYRMGYHDGIQIVINQLIELCREVTHALDLSRVKLQSDKESEGE